MATYDERHTANAASSSKTGSETDIYLLAGGTGDLNPARINAGEAANNMFRQRIAHGILTATLDCPETLGQRNWVKFNTTVTNQDGKVVVAREATVVPPPA